MSKFSRIQRSKHSILTAAVALALPLCMSSCAAFTIGAGAGYVISQEIISDKAQVAHVTSDVEDVWKAAVESLDILGIEELQLNNGPPRTAVGNYRKGKLSLQVEAFDIDHTILRVDYDRTALPDGKVAEEVMNYVLDRLGISKVSRID